MSTSKTLFIAMIFLTNVIGFSESGFAPPKLENPLKGKYLDAETTSKDITELALTIYNDDLALVCERRKITLLPGEQTLRYVDIPQFILPETVTVRSVSSPDTLHLLEQNYEYDLVNPSKLLEKFLGKKIVLQNFNKDFTFESVEATLLNFTEPPIFKIEDHIFLGHPGQIVLLESTEDLATRPTLLWLLKNEGTDHEIEVTYLTHGIAWQADYVLQINPDQNRLSLQGWATIRNQCGTSFDNAQVQLVAGNLHIVSQHSADSYKTMSAGYDLRSPTLITPEPSGEYYLYPISRRTTLKHNQVKQIGFLMAENVPFQTQYEFHAAPDYFLDYKPNTTKQNPQVYLEFLNTSEASLGIPIPAGIARIYQRDITHRMQFLGEDKVPHTPKNEKIRLLMGTAFDIVAERIQKDFSRVSPFVTETSFEITLYNHKDTNVLVSVLETLPTEDWTILSSSHDFHKRDARTIVFIVQIEPQQTAILSYQVRITTR